jgi:3-oxoacyl-[acyl-carrier protein] reductase
VGRLDGRGALVTGGTRGIGKAIARRFAEEGARVCVVDLDGEAAQETASKLPGEAFGLALDVSDRAAVDRKIAEVAERCGGLDVLVNNARVTRDNLLFKMSDEEWASVMDVHLAGWFYCSRAAQRYMVKGGYGRIVNISSTSALGNRGQANYSTAKALLQGFTKTLPMELGRFGITTNAVAPGFIETEMTRTTAARLGFDDFEKFVELRAKEIPVGTQWQARGRGCRRAVLRLRGGLVHKRADPVRRRRTQSLAWCSSRTA